MGSGNSNDLHTAVNWIKDFPANLTFIQVGHNIKVGVATFYSIIHFYNLKPTLQQVLPLSFTIREVQEIGLQVQMLNTIFGLVAHITDVIPYANKLVQFFQKAWEESHGESLLWIQLLTALRNFVAALGYQSPICYNLLMPILPSVLNANSPDEILEDSLQLWEVTLSHATSIAQLLGYFPCLMEILERSFDHLEV
ncbi:hypothetical protein OROMI_026194 [Orobanche minor]